MSESLNNKKEQNVKDREPNSSNDILVFFFFKYIQYVNPAILLFCFHTESLVEKLIIKALQGTLQFVQFKTRYGV